MTWNNAPYNLQDHAKLFERYNGGRCSVFCRTCAVCNGWRIFDDYWEVVNEARMELGINDKQESINDADKAFTSAFETLLAITNRDDQLRAMRLLEKVLKDAKAAKLKLSCRIMGIDEGKAVDMAAFTEAQQKQQQLTQHQRHVLYSVLLSASPGYDCAYYQDLNAIAVKLTANELSFTAYQKDEKDEQQ